MDSPKQAIHMEEIDHQSRASRWVHDYSDILYTYALPRVPDTHLAKDLVQETFLAAWRNKDAYNGAASEKTWLFTILKNKIIDHYRKAVHRLTDELMADTEGQHLYFDAVDHWVKGTTTNEWGINYDTPIEAKEFYDVLETCKRKLKEIQRIVFNMKYMDGNESDEICKELGLSSSNYWVLLHRAKVQLRACLEKNWFVR